jgi:hypothetical protein
MWILFLAVLLLIVYLFSKWVKNIKTREFTVNDGKSLQKNYSEHKENLLSDIPKSSVDKTNSGKSRN